MYTTNNIPPTSGAYSWPSSIGSIEQDDPPGRIESLGSVFDGRHQFTAWVGLVHLAKDFQLGLVQIRAGRHRLHAHPPLS